MHNILPPQEDVEIQMQPYVDRLRTCILTAWRKWRVVATEAANAGASPTALRTRSRANIMYDFMRDAIIREFATDSTVSWDEPHGVLWLNISGTLVLRFKMLDSKRRARNLATNRQREISLQLELPDMPAEALRLTVGYQLDRAESGIAAILVTCYVGKTEQWFFDTAALARQAQLFPDVMPTPDDAPAPTIRPKKRAAAEEPEQKANDGNR